MRGKPLTIAGGGLAGSLVALALAKLRPEVPFMLIEQSETFGGNHIWSFFDADIAAADRWLVEPFIARSWDGYDIRFPARARTLPTRYNSTRSKLLDRLVRERLRPDQYRLGMIVPGHEIDIDARGAAHLEALDLGWQKFVGREVRLAAPHGLERPIVMDACVDQVDGYRFIYCLPFAEDRLLIEDTYYSADAALDRDALGRRIEAYAEKQGWRVAAVEHEETGVLPVAMGGDFDAFWPESDRAARIGLCGGFFHPTTGYSLPDAVRTAMLIARQEDFSNLPTVLRAASKRLWKARGFYRLLDRMLFRAAAPAERYRVLEHFYRLDPALIERFYAGQSTLADKARILSGKPPVPLRRALKALAA
ncbi:lycopene beta-cyclase CrtY [Sphingosinicella sp.]|uniref:lycopene beta-cyclase CrtY n=1 Tax=Sphingosinicella sp. TaxID=1917971 RepID=UPI004037B447